MIHACNPSILWSRWISNFQDSRGYTEQEGRKKKYRLGENEWGGRTVGTYELGDFPVPAAGYILGRGLQFLSPLSFTFCTCWAYPPVTGNIPGSGLGPLRILDIFSTPCHSIALQSSAVGHWAIVHSATEEAINEQGAGLPVQDLGMCGTGRLDGRGRRLGKWGPCSSHP